MEGRTSSNGDGAITNGFGRSKQDELQEPLIEDGNFDCSHKDDCGLRGGSSFFQALLNAINVLAGVGILSTPYAVAQGGWLGLGFLVLFATICCYTGSLIRRCVDTNSDVRNYPDIGKAAFGELGRLVVSVMLYVDLFLVSVEFLILEGDNLSELFPIHDLVWGRIIFTPRMTFMLIAALVMLPPVWLRNLSSLAYVSAGGAFACLAIVLAVGWVGAFDGVGFHPQGSLLNLGGLPVAVGLYAFCYCGHAVYPNIYISMKNRSEFNKVLVVSFIVCTFLYGAIAVLGYLMFGNDIQSQLTLNLPKELLASKIAIWITLINPLAKYPLTLMPIARALEEWAQTDKKHVLYGMALRTLLVGATVIFALTVPVFGYLMAFIGSLLSVSTAIIIPCLCYLKLFRTSISRPESCLNLLILCLGAAVGIVGTYSSTIEIIRNLP